MGSEIRPVHVLLVEDHKADIALTKRAFKQGRLNNTLSVAFDGVEALQYLRKEGVYKEALRPDIILLDLRMPRMDGLQTLREIKSDEGFRTIPVIILTVSDDADDVLGSYGLHANAYISKPVDFDKFKSAIDSIGDFWFSVVQLPT